MADWLKILIPLVVAVLALARVFAKPWLDHRAEERNRRRPAYNAVLENEQTILHGLDRWAFDTSGDPSPDMIERRRNREELDRGLIGTASPEVKKLEYAVQDASDMLWHAIQEHQAVMLGSRIDAKAVYDLVNEKKAEAHAALDELERRIRRELRWP